MIQDLWVRMVYPQVPISGMATGKLCKSSVQYITCKCCLLYCWKNARKNKKHWCDNTLHVRRCTSLVITTQGVCVWVLSKFNGTSTPKGSYHAKTGDNDCNVNSSRYRLSTALCESIRYQAKSEQDVRQDLIPRVRHGEAALCTPLARYKNTGKV